MRIRRIALATTVGLALALVTGCDGGEGKSPTEASASTNPQDLLRPNTVTEVSCQKNPDGTFYLQTGTVTANGGVIESDQILKIEPAPNSTNGADCAYSIDLVDPTTRTVRLQKLDRSNPSNADTQFLSIDGGVMDQAVINQLRPSFDGPPVVPFAKGDAIFIFAEVKSGNYGVVDGPPINLASNISFARRTGQLLESPLMELVNQNLG